MFRNEIMLNNFNRSYLQNLLKDLSEESLDVQPAPGLHSTRWILAHLAVVSDYGFMMLDLPKLCPLEWHKAYGPASQPGSCEKVRPSQLELIAAINDGYDKLCHACRTVSVEHLGLPHGVGLLEGTPLQSRGDLICHILSSHFAAHLGQLSTNRRLLGRPPLF